MTPETHTKDHIEESLLLAYLRRQQLEDGLSLRITRHIEVERCPRCRHQLSELAQLSATLDGLRPMLSSQQYPEISVAQTYARVLSTASRRSPLQASLHRMNTRQRSSMPAIRLVGLPVAFALTLLVTVSLLVFASFSARQQMPDSPGEIKQGPPPISTVVAPAPSTPSCRDSALCPSSSPTPKLALTPQASIGASATPALTPTSTATPAPTPTTTGAPVLTPTTTGAPVLTPTSTATPTATPTPVQEGCSATATITSNFNGTPIAGNNYIWFTSVMKVQGLPSSETWISLRNQQITFTANGQQYSLPVPDAEVDLNPTASSATTGFSTDQGMWQTTSPGNVSGNIFLSALAFQVPSGGFPGGINPVTWSGQFILPLNTSITINWQWAAAVYTSFSGDYNQDGVKPVDDNHIGPFYNSDPAGTPENFKSYVIGGARGGGGSNFTGGLSGTASASC